VADDGQEPPEVTAADVVGAGAGVVAGGAGELVVCGVDADVVEVCVVVVLVGPAARLARW
jgi:hypothetical protein